MALTAFLECVGQNLVTWAHLTVKHAGWEMQSLLWRTELNTAKEKGGKWILAGRNRCHKLYNHFLVQHGHWSQRGKDCIHTGPKLLSDCDCVSRDSGCKPDLQHLGHQSGPCPQTLFLFKELFYSAKSASKDEFSSILPIVRPRVNGKPKSNKGSNKKEIDDPCFSKFVKLSTPFVRGETELKWSEWPVTSVQKNSGFCLLKNIFSSFSVFTVAHFYFSVLNWLRSCDKNSHEWPTSRSKRR